MTIADLRNHFSFSHQAAGAAVAIPLQTEKFYDLIGGATFIGASLLSLYLPSIRAKQPLPNILSFHPRQLIATTVSQPGLHSNDVTDNVYSTVHRRLGCSTWNVLVRQNSTRWKGFSLR